MRKLGFAMLLACTAAMGCGGGDDDGADRVELPIDSGTTPDMTELPDAAPPRGDVLDFFTCVRDDDCMNPDSHCRAIPWINGAKECIPTCDSSPDCPFGTYCYPTGGGNLGVDFALMGDHCWYSLCGEWLKPAAVACDDASVADGTDPNDPYSCTGQPCYLGKEAGVTGADLLPGWCLPISDGDFGQCIEAGTLPPGSTCDFGDQTRNGSNCDANGLCVGNPMNPQGTCAQICDPRLILADAPTDCTMAGQNCQDGSSVLTYGPGDFNRQTIGFCNDLTACKLIGTNTCPNDMMGQAQGCFPSNSLRPTGFCDAFAQGSLAVDAACPEPSSSAPPDTMQCTAGSLCNDPAHALYENYTPSGPWTGSCQSFCRTTPKACTGGADCEPSESCVGSVCVLNGGFAGGPDVDCTTIDPAYTCQPAFFDYGFDRMSGTTATNEDNNYSLDWGTCR